MADYVLVHGAWGGGWAYDRLARELTERGHRVVVAQLAGLGTRRDGLNPAIDLSTHINDVLGQIEAADFDRFVLCGHSYGGMVITGVAARVGARIDALVYIDAFLPADGQSLWDITGEFEHRHYIDSQKQTPGLVGPIMGELSDRISRHPLLTLIEGVRFTGAEQQVGRRVYIFANNWQPTPFRRFFDQVRSDGGWEVHEAVSGHDVMSDQPEQLLKIVLAAAV
ncbi:MAG: alpha/beta fold hydrolase [Novosphingobium sp.]